MEGTTRHDWNCGSSNAIELAAIRTVGGLDNGRGGADALVLQVEREVPAHHNPVVASSTLRLGWLRTARGSATTRASTRTSRRRNPGPRTCHRSVTLS